MNIEAKNLSKIYGDGENRVVALDRANLKLYPAILFPSWGHREAEKVPCCICFPAWISHLPAR